MKKQYDKVYVLFKENNREIYDWVLSEAEDGDLSRSSFILQCLKKIKKTKESENGEISNV